MAPPEPPPLILLRRATLQPAARMDVHLDSHAAAAAARADDAWWAGSCTGAARYLVMLQPPLAGVAHAALHAALARGGAAALGYVPHHTLLVLANATTLEHLASLPFVRHLRALDASYVLAPELEDAIDAAGAGGSAPLDVHLSTVSAPGLCVGAIRDAATTLLDGRGAVLGAHAPAPHGRRNVTHARLVLRLEAACARDVLEVLAAQPWAQWLELAPALRVRNFYASALLQRADSTAAAAAAPATAEARRLWDAGLRGHGQLIGIGDSGVDLRSCYFADRSGPNGSALPPGPDHRKLAAYNAALGDASDGNGHGTHTAGTLAGACDAASASRSDAARWDGVAPGARLVFTDLGTGAGGSLFLPTSLGEFFDYAYSRGARVHSDSWGGDLPSYDAMAREVDDFTFSHRDFLRACAQRILC